MTERPPTPTLDPVPDETARIDDGAFRLVVAFVIVFVGLIALRAAADLLPATGPGSSPAVAAASPSSGPAASGPLPAGEVAALLLDDPVPAPALSLTGPDGPVTLETLRGTPVLVFFGYTHCPDVCPATIGTVGLAIDAYGREARAILVSVDPERDTPAWLTEFVRYLPAGFTAVSGTPDAVRRTADAWGVRYAKVETGDPDAYAMSHTADVFVVDAGGMLRARLPFGTDAPTTAAVLEAIDARPGASPATAARPATSAPPAGTPIPSPAPTASAGPVATLVPELVSSSIWAGGASPLIFTVDDAFLGRASDPRTVAVQVTTREGAAVGPPVTATPVHPSGIATVSFVAAIDIPTAGPWTAVITATDGGREVARGSLPVTALDPGGTAPLGVPAPTARTRTPAEVGGDLTWLTTDPLPDPRLSATSTTDALASGEPWVLVVDSIRFRVTPQCGQAVVLAKRLVDRWNQVPFIHHEPYRYSVVTTEPVLEGTLAAPVLTDVADAWGVGSQPWGFASMPWVFVIDGDGVVRAKYQGVIGSADVDVMLALLTTEGS